MYTTTTRMDVKADVKASPRLAPGTRLGPYEIGDLIGAGGMGEVYRAHDTRLARDVAVKVLRARSGGDPELLRRFAIEARAGGGVNHANILTIYDVGLEGDQPYVVSELLAGATLRARLADGPLPTLRALDVARQVAAGLAAAHEHGVVHRDLKPENLFVTSDGTVKILDFGVAKLLAPAAADEAHAATAPLQTQDGVVVGTAGYMSPEQVRALPTDTRSDLFSLGAILYEMLSGRRAFEAGSAVETGMAILKDEPPPLQAVAPGLELLVARCLEKDPTRRFQSARDLGFALEAVAAPRPAELPAGPRRRPARALGPALGVAAAAFVAGWLIPHVRPSAPAAESFDYRRLTFRSGVVAQARFASDGQIIYDARWGDRGGRAEIFTVRPDSPESRALGLPPSQLLAVSRNGELAVLLDASRPGPRQLSGTLARVPLAGGAPREVLRDVETADWAPDGAALAIARSAGGMDRLEFPVGTLLYETTGSLKSIRFSPRGDHIAFLHHPLPADDRGEVMVVDLDGRARTLSPTWGSISGLAWSPSGEIWFTAAEQGADATLYATTLEGRQRVVVKAPGRLTLLDIAPDGRVLLNRATGRWAISVLAPGEARERDLSWFDWSYIGDFAADGRSLLFFESGQAVGANYRAYLRRTDGTDPVWLGQGGLGALSADGKWALLTQIDRPEVLELVPTGAGETRTLPAGSLTKRTVPAWFPDGKRIAYAGSDAGGSWRVYVQDLDGAPRAISPEGFMLDTAQAVAPDGGSILALDAENRPVILPADGGEPRLVAGLRPGEHVAHWAPDHELFVFGDTIPCPIWRVDPVSARRERVREIAPPITAPAGLRELFLTQDASAYGYSFDATVSDLYLAERRAR
jgi:Tol biopolymer transport system component